MVAALSYPAARAAVLAGLEAHADVGAAQLTDRPAEWMAGDPVPLHGRWGVSITAARGSMGDGRLRSAEGWRTSSLFLRRFHAIRADGIGASYDEGWRLIGVLEAALAGLHPALRMAEVASRVAPAGDLRYVELTVTVTVEHRYSP
jgi:hypothetical protein